MFLNIVLLILGVGLDQFSKYLVSSSMTFGESITIIPNVLNFNLTYNTGAAFSILEGKQWIFILITILVLIFLIREMLDTLSVYYKMSLIVLISGIIGNLIDRIAHGYVIDFIQIDKSLIQFDFPIFNVSDILIVGGVIMLLLRMLLKRNHI